jgi:hypothetical protein
MSQNDFNLANQGFPSMRSDINSALQALASNSSGDTAPATPYANQFWYETDTNILHIRDEANAAWLDLMVINGTTGSPSFNSGNVAFDTNTLFVDATNNRVGVGTASPAGALHARFDAGVGDGYTGKYIFQTVDQRLTIGTFWQAGVGQHARIQSSTEVGIAQSLLLNPDGGSVIIGGQTLLMPTSSALTTLSGSSVDFTGIPSTARRVTVSFNALSTTGTNVPLIQLGDAGGIETSGYTGAVGVLVNAAASQVTNFSSGVSLSTTSTAASVYQGSVTFDLMDATTNRWAVSGTAGRSDAFVFVSYGGSKALSQTLTQVRLTTNSADTFDGGTATVSWE